MNIRGQYALGYSTMVDLFYEIICGQDCIQNDSK